MAGFVEFVASGKKELAIRFVEALESSKTPADLAAWFKNENFSVDEKECEILLKSKDSLLYMGKKVASNSY
jgi:hypothetical protein